MDWRNLEWIIRQDRTFLIFEAYRQLGVRLADQGFNVEVVSGDVDYQPVVGASRNEYMFYNSPDSFDRTPENFLTFRLWDSNGGLRAIQGARLESIGRLSLEEFMAIQIKRLHKASDGRRSQHQINPAAKQITGNVVYHGDLIASQKPQLPRGVLESFCVITMIVSLSKWDHDFSWCYLRDKHARADIARRYGLFHQYPNAVLWDELPDPHWVDDWLAFNTKHDIEYLAQASLLGPQSVGKQPSKGTFPFSFEQE